MKKKIEIVPYNNSWPKIFNLYAKELKNTLLDNCVKIYHVGSTSVSGLCSKPIIDIMCVVKDLKSVIDPLEQIGFNYKGEFNLPMRLFFSKKKPHDIHVHVVRQDSGEIAWNLTFQNYLRVNDEARELYANVKLKLIKENPDGFNMIEGLFSEYTTKKGEIIREIARIAGFDGYRFVIVENFNEMEEYKKLMNVENIDFSNKNIFHLCLYKGVQIVGAACVKFDKLNSLAVIHSIVSIDQTSKNILLEKLKQWTEFHSLKLV